ncbi:MAG: transcriptional regulator, GntR family, partial [Phycisphaerales bacterium]|nr:transcriptional regulator, GntR family [Phycisphaerales bacterium]
MAKRSKRSKSGSAAGGVSPFEGLSEGRKSRHREVYDTLLNEITSGRFQPGDRLPTETELAVSFSASRSTISRALRDLKHRGLLNRQRGGGTHVAKPQQGKHIALFAPFAQTAANLGWIGGQIHAHLSEVASWRSDHLRLQTVGRLTDMADPLDAMLNAAQSLIDQNTSGVFYYPVELPAETAHYNQLVVDKLQAAKIPLVAVDRDIVSFPNRSSLPLVTYDNRRGGYLLTDHLIQRGCRRIVFIGSPYVSSAASDRLRGYYDALEENDIGVDRSLVFKANLEDLDLDYCRRILDQAKPDAIVCKMDHYAAVVGRHLVTLKRTIGRDIKL